MNVKKYTAHLCYYIEKKGQKLLMDNNDFRKLYKRMNKGDYHINIYVDPTGDKFIQYHKKKKYMNVTIPTIKNDREYIDGSGFPSGNGIGGASQEITQFREPTLAELKMMYHSQPLAIQRQRELELLDAMKQAKIAERARGRVLKNELAPVDELAPVEKEIKEAASDEEKSSLPDKHILYNQLAGYFPGPRPSRQVYAYMRSVLKVPGRSKRDFTPEQFDAALNLKAQEAVAAIRSDGISEDPVVIAHKVSELMQEYNVDLDTLKQMAGVPPGGIMMNASMEGLLDAEKQLSSHRAQAKSQSKMEPWR